jgi:pimeloyl-ACP methyl ester carboxylesterase
MIPIYDFGGSGPAIHLSVANGFPAQTYAPLLGPLTPRYHVLSVLPRALWPDPPAPDSIRSWQHAGEDILAGLASRSVTGVVAIGHSMGAVASVFAVLAEPERFRALILLDPTFVEPGRAFTGYLLRIAGRQFPLAKGALRRRSKFESVDEAYGYWRGKSLFRDWPDETVRLYAESITRPDGHGVKLAWSPQWEARYYQTVHLPWRREVRKLRGLLPVLAIQGGLSDTFTEHSADVFRRLVPDATFRQVEGRGHFFPLSAPDQTRALIEDWLSALPA